MVRAALAYFLLVFGVGFVLGVVRTLWLVPALGERWAELAEMPFMLVAIVFAARWIGRRFSLAVHGRGSQIAVGLFAFGLLLAAELTVVLQLRGLTLAEYVATRDPVSGTAYGVSLLLFAAMPALLTKSSE